MNWIIIILLVVVALIVIGFIIEKTTEPDDFKYDITCENIAMNSVRVVEPVIAKFVYKNPQYDFEILRQWEFRRFMYLCKSR